MDGLVGRLEELRYLNTVYAKSPVACAVCGRRHLGKTALLSEFCKDKMHIYLSGINGLKEENLAEMSRAINKFGRCNVNLTDVEDLFPALKKVCGKNRVVVVIDRYSDLVDNFPEFTSYLRGFMNRDINTTKMMLVVCDTDSSVFGRFYYTLDVKSMSYRDCIGFHPGYTPMQHLIAYSVVGGTPAYQKMFVGTPEDVIKDQFFDHMSVFSLEVEGMVNSEATMRTPCTKALSAMAAGVENLRDISSRTGFSSSICLKAIEDMENKGMVQKEVSSGPSKRTVYSIHSNILRFYYEVVNHNTYQMEFESPEAAYERAKPDISRYLERAFKTLCMDYITLTFKYSFVGKLRRKDDSADSVVDFVAAITDNNVNRTAIATCRLYGNQFEKRDLDTLMTRSKTISGQNRMYLMFSGTGFSQELKDLAEKDRNIRLITLDDIYSI